MGDQLRRRPWWLRPNGLPPSWEARQAEMAGRPFTVERAARMKRLMAIGTVFNAAVTVATLVIYPLTTRHGGHFLWVLIVIWVVLLGFVLHNYRRGVRRLAQMVKDSGTGLGG